MKLLSISVVKNQEAFLTRTREEVNDEALALRNTSPVFFL